MKKVLTLSNNYTSDKIAGIAIRFVEIAKALSRTCEVTLGLSNTKGYSSDKFKIAEFRSDSDILALMKKNDVLLTRGLDIVNSSRLRNFDIPMIFDLLCPFFFEGLESDKTDIKMFNDSLKENRGYIEKLALRGDFFLCANDEMRNFWLSALYQNGRITRDLYMEDPSLKKLIDNVPFGLDPSKPVHSKKVMKGVLPGIKESDKVVLWLGGIWDWLDPLSVINALNSISKVRNDIKLVFVGGKHPDPSSKAHDMVERTVNAAKQAGLYDKTVFFIDWIPYEERANYLLESDIGMITHKDNLETRFSWRTRVLDHLWAGLPTICTKGDPMGRIIEDKELGLTVEYNDPTDIEKAILRMIDDAALRSKAKKNIEDFRPRLKWDKVVEPIERFCLSPRRTSKRPSMLERLIGK